MKKKGAGRQADDAEDAVKSLGQHALNFAANETEVARLRLERASMFALDAAFFFLIDGMTRSMQTKATGRAETIRMESPMNLCADCSRKKARMTMPREKRPRREGRSARVFMVAAFLPEKISDGDVDEGRRDKRGGRENLESVGGGPERKNYCRGQCGFEPQFAVRVELSAEEEEDSGEPEERVIQGTEDDVGANQGERAGQR